MANEILLEAGTNEMELLLFQVGLTTYGINVAKVRELIPKMDTIKIPCAPKSIEGSFALRDEVLTLIGLGRYLGIPEEQWDASRQLIIVIELNRQQCGILVDSVNVIQRLRWDQIEAPSELLVESGTPVTGIAKVDDNVVLILDFETIVGDLLGSTTLDTETENVSVKDERKEHLLIADDSPTIRNVIENKIRSSGFTNLTICTDGLQAWETIERSRNNKDLSFDLVLTDIEMPRMDGLRLTKKIKDDPELAMTPVILFSSLISPEMANKGEAVGANAQISKKSTSQELLDTINGCLAQSKG